MATYGKGGQNQRGFGLLVDKEQVGLYMTFTSAFKVSV